MGKNHFGRAGESQSIDDAGVIGGVRKNDIARANNGAQQADVRRVAGIEVQSRFRSHKLCDFGLELLPDFRVAGEKARAGRAHGTPSDKRGSNGL